MNNKLKAFFGLMAIVVMSSFSFAEAKTQEAQTPYHFFIQVPGKKQIEMRKLTGWLNQHNFDVAGINLESGQVEVITSEQGLSLLKSKGWNGKVKKVDLIQGKNGSSARNLDPRFYTSAKIENKLNDIHAQYPKTTKVVEIGKSLENRSILALVVSTTPDFNDPKFHEKPTYLFDAMHHAREVMTPEIAIDIGETLLSSADKGESVALQTLTKANVVIIPMLNVDGNSMVWSEDSMWRKNAHQDSSGKFGVDINRNYPYQFAACNGSSTHKSAQDYHGEAGGSEPETQAMMALAEKIHPMASISYHSYSELVLYPYGCEGQYTSENDMIAKIGHELASKLPTDSGRGFYAPGTAWELLYPVDGDSMSYLYASYGALSYVFEVNQSFQPSFDLRDPTVKKHQAAWQFFLNETQQHLLTVEVRDSSGKPAQSKMTITEIPHVHSERDFSTNAGGNFFKVLMPGNYSIEIKLKNGNKTVIPVNMADQAQTVVIKI